MNALEATTVIGGSVAAAFIGFAGQASASVAHAWCPHVDGTRTFERQQILFSTSLLRDPPTSADTVVATPMTRRVRG
ncbi:hypothetical protein [Nocardia sp. NBC_01388]|uniref:hypothetical protein n=1 Tax=Nocardia sp. NBC_01388 TaxID=2903596 RepID=UPI0032497FA1